MTLISSIAIIACAGTSQGAVEVPFKLGDNAIIVDATVNGRKVALMFDTGFSGAVVLASGINIGKPTGTMVLRDFVGQFEAPTVKITSLKLGAKSIEPEDMEAVISPGADYSFSYNTHCDGIMGFEVIAKNVVEISFEKQRFIFHPKAIDISKRAPDGKTSFLGRLLPSGHKSLELDVRTPDGKRLTMALDTGNAFYATTHKDSLERVGLWKPGAEPKFLKSSFVASGEVTSWYKRMANMSIYGVKVPESTWSIIDLPSSSAEADGTVGFEFLRNFNLTIDYERRRVWLENYTGKVGNEPAGDLGLSAAMDPDTKRVRIARVSPDSPADKAGIKRGDTVLSIDGQTELNVGWRRLNALFEGPKGSKAKLVLSRNGNLMRFELERMHLVND